MTETLEQEYKKMTSEGLKNHLALKKDALSKLLIDRQLNRPVDKFINIIQDEINLIEQELFQRQ